MAETISKSLDEPDETIRFPGITEELVEIGDVTVGRVVHEPGFRWSTHARPLVGGDWCQARHLGIVLSGRMGIELQDGTTFQFGPNDVYDVPPGHDGYTVGDEPCVAIEWSGLRAFAGFRPGARKRVLATLLVTDIAGAAEMADRLGEGAWRALLSTHYETARAELERFRGREVKTTGDGMFATFDGPALAMAFAAARRRTAAREGVPVRAAVHVGEVEPVGSDYRGTPVQVAARILDEAAEGEILVSEIARSLTTDLAYEERPARALPGLPGEWRLFAYMGESGSTPR